MIGKKEFNEASTTLREQLEAIKGDPEIKSGEMTVALAKHMGIEDDALMEFLLVTQDSYLDKVTGINPEDGQQAAMRLLAAGMAAGASSLLTGWHLAMNFRDEQILTAAANRLSEEEGDNPEYDRAIVELVDDTVYARAMPIESRTEIPGFLRERRGS